MLWSSLLRVIVSVFSPKEAKKKKAVLVTSVANAKQMLESVTLANKNHSENSLWFLIPYYCAYGWLSRS